MTINRRVALVAAFSLVACSGEDASGADVLLFAGTGASPNDVSALKAILRDAGLGYATADTAQINAMSRDDLRRYRLLIIPGGNFEDMGGALTPEAAAALGGAVRDGLNYLGVCAGAFIAGASPYNGLNLTDGKAFGFYTLEAQGFRKSAVWITTADGARTEQYWEDGPELSGWGDPIALYPDGTPAAVTGEVGQGRVVLVGTHPEAPESWRREVAFTTPARDSHKFAKMLIETALGRSNRAIG